MCVSRLGIPYRELLLTPVDIGLMALLDANANLESLPVVIGHYIRLQTFLILNQQQPKNKKIKSPNKLWRMPGESKPRKHVKPKFTPEEAEEIFKNLVKHVDRKEN